MKDFPPASPSSRKNIHGKGSISKDSAATVGREKFNARVSGTGDASRLNIEKDLYALLDLCVHLLEMETKRKELCRMRLELRNLDAPMAAKLKKEEIVLRKIISLTQKRLRGTCT